MRPWTQYEIDAYAALADRGKLIDPKYAPHPDREEVRLKDVVKKNWPMRQHFPAWVKSYIDKWSAEERRASA